MFEAKDNRKLQQKFRNQMENFGWKSLTASKTQCMGWGVRPGGRASGLKDPREVARSEQQEKQLDIFKRTAELP